MKRYRPVKFPAKDLIATIRPMQMVRAMMERIKEDGRVFEPVHVVQETNHILVGNRRVLAVQRLLEEDISPELRAAITKLDVIFYSGCTEQDLAELTWRSNRPMKLQYALLYEDRDDHGETCVSRKTFTKYSELLKYLKDEHFEDGVCTFWQIRVSDRHGVFDETKIERAMTRML